MNENDKQPPRPGSARAKLEAFERKQKGKSLLWRRLLIMAGILAVVLAIKLGFDFFNESNRAWFSMPKDAAWMMQDGQWDNLEQLLSKDLVIDGAPGVTRDNVIEILKSRGEKLPVFATHPHAFDKSESGPWVSFFATWARGDLKKKSVVPYVQTWLVHAELTKEDGDWKVRRLTLRPTIDAGSVEQIALPK